MKITKVGAGFAIAAAAVFAPLLPAPVASAQPPGACAGTAGTSAACKACIDAAAQAATAAGSMGPAYQAAINACYYNPAPTSP
jgi:hypothetical protein